MTTAVIASEDGEQATVVEWAQRMEYQHPELKRLYAIPNGGYRHKATAAKLKRTGVKPGVPDLCLPAARGGYHGLYIEMKTLTGDTSPEQEDWIEYLNGAGYFTEVCHGCDSAIRVLKWYLNLR